ncbi:MAG: ion channel [Deltaproteobacteria bacterium]|nr:ion channel [Deltaproteobacteria bacterium]
MAMALRFGWRKGRHSRSRGAVEVGEPSAGYRGSRLFGGLRTGSGQTDLYHFLLASPWPVLLLMGGAALVVVNSLFALAYMLSRGLEAAQPLSFVDVFLFSVQTMATVGSSQAVARTVMANALVGLEATTGFCVLAIATAVSFARISRPTARVRFSRVAVVSQRDGAPALWFRMANVRGNRIVEAQVRLMLARWETTAEGEPLRRLYDLALVRDRTALFALSWSVFHRLDGDSPLCNATPQTLLAGKALIVVSVTGIDETFMQTVHARHVYRPQEVIFGARLADILSESVEGRLLVDYARFDEVIDLPEGAQ